MGRVPLMRDMSNKEDKEQKRNTKVDEKRIIKGEGLFRIEKDEKDE